MAAAYRHERIAPSAGYDARSFRTIPLGKRGGKLGVVACPKGAWRAKTQRCARGMQMVSKLGPKGNPRHGRLVRRQNPPPGQHVPGIARWNMFAGGTSALEGKHSYSLHVPGGEFHVWPPSMRWGGGSGYSVLFAHTHAGGVDGVGLVGLWSDIGRARSPAAAAALARQFYAAHFPHVNPLTPRELAHVQSLARQASMDSRSLEARGKLADAYVSGGRGIGLGQCIAEVGTIGYEGLPGLSLNPMLGAPTLAEGMGTARERAAREGRAVYLAWSAGKGWTTTPRRPRVTSQARSAVAGGDVWAFLPGGGVQLVGSRRNPLTPKEVAFAGWRRDEADKIGKRARQSGDARLAAEYQGAASAWSGALAAFSPGRSYHYDAMLRERNPRQRAPSVPAVLKPSVAVAWSPVNQRWFVLWGTGPLHERQVLYTGTREDVGTELARIARTAGNPLTDAESAKALGYTRDAMRDATRFVAMGDAQGREFSEGWAKGMAASVQTFGATERARRAGVRTARRGTAQLGKAMRAAGQLKGGFKRTPKAPRGGNPPPLLMVLNDGKGDGYSAAQLSKTFHGTPRRAGRVHREKVGGTGTGTLVVLGRAVELRVGADTLALEGFSLYATPNGRRVMVSRQLPAMSARLTYVGTARGIAYVGPRWSKSKRLAGETTTWDHTFGRGVGVWATADRATYVVEGGRFRVDSWLRR